MNVYPLLTLDGRLRAVPTDRDALERAVGEVRAALTAAPAEVALARQLGSGLLALGEYAEAAAVLARVVEAADGAGDVRTAVKARINLADAYRYPGDFATAEPIYRRALADARRAAPDLVDFPLQHLGKHRAEEGRLDEALLLLREALALRLAKGEPALIASTRAALTLFFGPAASGAADDLAVQHDEPPVG